MNLAKKNFEQAIGTSGSAENAGPHADLGPSAPLTAHGGLLEGLYGDSRGAEYGISFAEFTTIVEDVLAGRSNTTSEPLDIDAFLSSWHAEEVMLARACANANEYAWQVFISRYRESIYGAAWAIARDDVIAHDLADSLYGTLLGAEGGEGEKSSKLRSYNGTGSLQGWLRMILAHEFIDHCRSRRVTVSLNGTAEDDEFDVPAPPAAASVPADPRVDEATDAALATLPAEDRYLLSSYYLHGRTLADIAATLGLHESTVSRRIDKLTVKIRKNIVAGLVSRGMSRDQAKEALDTEVGDLKVDVRARLEENLQVGGSSPSLEQKSISSRFGQPGTAAKGEGE